jgi:hypothetical protein
MQFRHFSRKALEGRRLSQLRSASITPPSNLASLSPLRGTGRAPGYSQIVERTVKNKELRMTSAELEKLIASLLDIQGNRCALTGIPFNFLGPDADKNLLPSADRIDSSGHYEAGNLQIVCQFINFWKSDSNNEDFKRLLMLVRGMEAA